MTIPENPFALSHSSGRNANTQNEEIMTEEDKHPGKEIRDECIARDNVFYDQQKQNTKFEEIKSMAEKILVETLLYDDAVENWTTENLNVIWKIAEDFYDFAKEKEGEKL